MCKPNPCKHGGKCTTVTVSHFSCDCSGTDYQGKTCERGVIVKPDFPTLVAGVSTKSLEFRASPPDNYFILAPFSPYIKFNPSTLLFKKRIRTPVSVTMTALQPGLHFLQFKLRGPGAAVYEVPQSVVFFVESARNTVKKLPAVTSKELTFPFGRCKLELDKCPSSDLTVSAYSTSPWRMFGPTAITYGQISLKTGNFELPHSVTGGNFARKVRGSLSRRCAINPSATNSATELTRRKVLAKSFLNAVSQSLPKWLDMRINDSYPLNSMLETDLQAYYLSGKRLREVAAIKGHPLSEDTFFSLLQSPDLDIIVNGDRVSFGTKDRSARFAVALELCGPSPNDVILRPSPDTTDVLNQLSVVKQLQDNGWMLKIDSLRISSKSVTERILTMYATFNKEFQVSDKIKSRVDFEGTILVNVDNLNSVSNFNIFLFSIECKLLD